MKYRDIGAGLLSTAFLWLVCTMANADEAARPPVAKRPVPVIHITDLFRPHNDPDDHWDLATQYALAAQGDIKLVGVSIHCPKAAWARDPDISAVAQMNYLTGLAVPVMTGVPEDFPLDADLKDPAVRNSSALGGIRALHGILRELPEPAVITATGWCRDLVLAYRYDPELFVQKCAGVYMNAGLGDPDPAKQKQVEYNVMIDPMVYRDSFKIPVPMYWLPCFRTLDKNWRKIDHHYGTYFPFRQGEILPELSDPMQNFFLSMHRDGGKKRGEKAPGKTDWLSVLHEKPDQTLLTQQSARDRHMWCTGGMLHMVGKTVLSDGSIVPLDKAGDHAVFAFRPIKVQCDDKGRTSWKPDEGNQAWPKTFIFEVCDQEHYKPAMAKALKTLVLQLGTKEKK